MAIDHLSPEQRESISDLLLYAISLEGKTISTLENQFGKQYFGDGDQIKYRHQKIWHKKEDLDEYVAKRLHLPPTLVGPDRISDDFTDTTSHQLSKFRRKGIIVDWNKQRRYMIFRLTNLNLNIKNPVIHLLELSKYKKYNNNNIPDHELKMLFMTVISKGKKDNTYKFTLAKILLDYCQKFNYNQKEYYEISYDYITKEFFRHYWHQIYKLNIEQYSSTKKQPVAVTVIKNIFGKYTFESFDNLDSNKVNLAIDTIRKKNFNFAKTKTQMVISKFQNIPYKHTIENVPLFYNYSDDEGIIYLKNNAFHFFKNNYDTLSKILNIEWLKYLNKINKTDMSFTMDY